MNLSTYYFYHMGRPVWIPHLKEPAHVIGFGPLTGHDPKTLEYKFGIKVKTVGGLTMTYQIHEIDLTFPKK